MQNTKKNPQVFIVFKKKRKVFKLFISNSFLSLFSVVVVSKNHLYN